MVLGDKALKTSTFEGPVRTSWLVAALEMMGHGHPVDVVLHGKIAGRGTSSVVADELRDLLRRQPTLLADGICGSCGRFDNVDVRNRLGRDGRDQACELVGLA
ncbi:hypothetical protein C5O27_18465 [Gordonia alkanivorans]|nr:hypothetical protein C5O27_18465 [Gordonia alkanivorans]